MGVLSEFAPTLDTNALDGGSNEWWTLEVSYREKAIKSCFLLLDGYML